MLIASIAASATTSLGRGEPDACKQNIVLAPPVSDPL
jgi:hypothetical protein